MDVVLWLLKTNEESLQDHLMHTKNVQPHDGISCFKNIYWKDVLSQFHDEAEAYYDSVEFDFFLVDLVGGLLMLLHKCKHSDK